MYPTTTQPRFSSDHPTVMMDTHDITAAGNPPLQPNSSVLNTAPADQLRKLQSLAGKRAFDPTPERVRKVPPSAPVNVGMECRMLFEQKRSPKQIANYHELRMHGIPARHILLEPRTNSYSPPNVSLKETIVHGDAPTLALRIHNGANPNEKDASGTPALVTAAALGNVDAVRILAGAGAELDARDAHRRTALLAASAAGHGDTAIALLPYFPALDATDAQGMTALMHLCAHGQPAAASLLLANGANPDLIATNGQDARRLAARHGHDGVFNKTDRMQDDQENTDGESSRSPAASGSSDIAMQ